MKQSAGLSRYIVGIDLGTTNSAMAYLDSESTDTSPRIVQIPQRTSASTVESLETLPSFHYEPYPGEFDQTGVELPHEPYCVGTFARDHGARLPDRLVASAKSWLSHSGVDRTADLLPWQSSETVRKISPVEASARFLKAMRTAWDAAFPAFPLKEQDVVLTLPASFDEVARELTVRAARKAGLPKIVLLEEPQAAFYAYLAHADALDPHGSRTVFPPGQKILVCDVGGGTTDFTLIRTRTDSTGRLRFHRVAVGEHLILGGDNLDLAIARHLEQRLAENGTKLAPTQWNVLVRLAMRVKERMLGGAAPEEMAITLPGTGTQLIGGGIPIDAKRTEIEILILDGFFPRVSIDARPDRRRSGFREFGLPFAADAAISRYLAEFLTTHRETGAEPGERCVTAPDAVLLNGGLFESPLLKRRLLDQLREWGSAVDPSYEPVLLENERLDLAVALGAAHFGAVRRGRGERIDASLARTYYIQVDSGQLGRIDNGQLTIDNEKTKSQRQSVKDIALSPEDTDSKVSTVVNCQLSTVNLIAVLPANAEPGREIELPHDFELLVDEPVAIPVFVSSVRLTDAPGTLLLYDPERMRPLPAIRTVLKTRRKKKEKTRVRLCGTLTEIGTLELRLHEIAAARPLSWRLEFDVRSATQTDAVQTGKCATGPDGPAEETIDESLWDTLDAAVASTFGGEEKPQSLMRRLEEIAKNEGTTLESLPGTLLRRLGDRLLERERLRRRGEAYEARFLNLLGYAYRPGFGVGMDDWRVETAWKTLQGSLLHPGPQVRTQSWIFWRRLAGGLVPGQQQTLADPLLGNVRQLHIQLLHGRGRGSDLDLCGQEGTEIWRLLGALEELPIATKIELGRIVLDLLPRRRMDKGREVLFWTLGRLGARTLLSGPLSAIVPATVAAEWSKRLIDEHRERLGDSPTARWALAELARRTDDRHRDLDAGTRDRVLAVLEYCSAEERLQKIARESNPPDVDEKQRLFGESLPMGLSLPPRQ